MKSLILIAALTLGSSAFAASWKCGSGKVITSAHNINVVYEGDRVPLQEQTNGTWSGQSKNRAYTVFTNGPEDGIVLEVKTTITGAGGNASVPMSITCTPIGK